MKNQLQSNVNWYALHTQSKFEKKIHENLLSRGYTSFLPLMTTIRQWSDRKKKVQLPLIPGYIFVKIDALEIKNLLWYHGVVGVLKHLGKPAKIKEYEIDNLKLLLEDTERVSFLESAHIQQGDSVIVEKGIFKGLIARSIKFNGKHRLIVQMEALANNIEVNIPLSHIKKIGDANNDL